MNFQTIELLSLTVQSITLLHNLNFRKSSPMFDECPMEMSMVRKQELTRNYEVIFLNFCIFESNFIQLSQVLIRNLILSNFHSYRIMLCVKPSVKQKFTLT